MPDNITKRQHYVPRFILKHFSTERNGEYYIWSYNKEMGESFETNIINIGVENWFYHKDNIFEKALSILEGEYSKIYEIIRNKSISSLTKEEKQLLVELVYIQDARTRKARDNLIRVNENIINSEDFKDWFEEVFPDIKIDDHLEDIKRYIQLSEMFGIDITYNKPRFTETLERIMELDIFLLKNIISHTGMEFYTSDHPVCYFSLSEKIDIKIVFPITPELCLIFTNDKQWELDHPSHQVITNKIFVEMANERTVLKANRYIFSKTKDFSFVKRILRE